MNTKLGRRTKGDPKRILLSRQVVSTLGIVDFVDKLGVARGEYSLLLAKNLAPEAPVRVSVETVMAQVSTMGLVRAGKSPHRHLWAAAAISAGLHALLSPLPALLGLAGMILQKAPLDEPPVDEIPIELLSEEETRPEPPPESRPIEAAAKEAVSAAVAPRAPETKTSATKTNEKKPLEKPATPKPKEAPLNGQTAARDPVAAAGDAGKIVDSNANVRVLLYNDRIRVHELGPKVSELLRRTPQWGEFFGPAGVDPVNDIDRVLFAGPSLRSTANMIAVVQHHLPEVAITEAFDGLVSAGGEWLSKKPLLVRAKADHAERVFASPGGKIVAVAPLSAEKSLRRLKKGLSFPAGPEGVVAQFYVNEMVTLAKLFRVPLGDTLGSGRVQIVPEKTGGLLMRVSVEDGDKGHTAEHAETLETLITELTQVDLTRFGTLGAFAAFAFGGSKTRFVQSVEFHGKDGSIEGEVKMTRAQLLTILDLLDGFLPPERPRIRKIPASQEDSESSAAAKDQRAPADASGREPEVARDSDAKAGTGGSAQGAANSGSPTNPAESVPARQLEKTPEVQSESPTSKATAPEPSGDPSTPGDPSGAGPKAP